MADSRRVNITRPGGVLDGVLALPGRTPEGGVVLCHPHPHFGGTMDNAVIVALARGFVADGLATLRFNFSGVGTSQGSAGERAVDDTRAALIALRAALPDGAALLLAGYSFGAWIALRAAADAPDVEHVVAIAPPLDHFPWDALGGMPRDVSVVAAEHDQFCSAERLAHFVEQHADRVTVVATLPGADHFFWGFEDQVADTCRSALKARRRAST